MKKWITILIIAVVLLIIVLAFNGRESSLENTTDDPNNLGEPSDSVTIGNNEEDNTDDTNNPVVENTPDPNSCLTWAESIKPEFLFMDKIDAYLMTNYYIKAKWKDSEEVESFGTNSGLPTLGTEEGQNVNHYYWGYKLIRERNLIADDGTILEKQKAIITPKEFIKIDSVEINTEQIGELVSGQPTEFKLTWSGFNDNIKEMIGSDSFDVRLQDKTGSGSSFGDVVYTTTIEEAEGSKTFEVTLVYGSLDIKTAPSVYEGHFFEIIDSDVRCE